ncbi:MAG: FkbM family methyltransferase [Candidatus Hodarchaeota archaeon]
MMIDSSQYGEYRFLKVYYKNHQSIHKIVVDVGACCKKYSNSYDLIMRHNWFGLLIEPDEENFKQLKKDFKNSNVELLNLAVADYCGDSKLYIHEARGHHSLVRKSNKTEEVTVATLPDILKIYNIPSDFEVLTTDTEGLDYRIIKFMLEKSSYRPQIIIHEKGHDINKKDCLDLMKKFGYKRINETPGNLIYEKRYH